VPATTDFGVKLDSNAAVTPNAVAIEDKTVLLTVDLAKAPGDQGGDVTYTEADVSYTKGTNPIRDPAGNEAAAFTGLEQTGLAAKVEVEAAGTPAVTAPPAPEPGTLVSNTGQSLGSSQGFAYDTAQAFTTGSNAGGYKLTSLTVPYATTTIPAASTHAISIHASNSSNRPGASLGTLSYGSVSGKSVTYTASGDGISLDGGTTYFVVIAPTSAPNLVAIKLTNSDNEDSGASDGWSLANTALRRLRATTTWQSQTDAWQIAIDGSSVVAPKATVTVPGDEAKLVGNTGQNRWGGDGFSFDIAQPFTTGSNSLGYKLTKLVVPYDNAAPPASSHTIKIHASNSSNQPGTSLGTLAYGTVSGTTVTYTASGEGIALGAGTTYFAVLDTSTVPAGNPEWQRTNSNNEDSGAADGWSIGNTKRWRSATFPNWSTDTTPWQIAIHGVAPERVPATAPADEGTLVGNTGQSTDTQGLFIFDYAHAFTTGSATGYTLTSVTVPYDTAAPPASSHTISIHDSNSSNRPGASLGTLAYGTVSGQTVTYTAASAGGSRSRPSAERHRSRRPRPAPARAG